MQISRYADYSLRVLFYLTVRPDARVTLAQVSDFYGISVEHLRKVVHRLAKLGYLRTYQGKGGGFELAGLPDTVNVGEVLAGIEGGKPMIDCMGIDCRLSNSCSLAVALDRAQRAFFDTLREYTLADMVSDRAMAKVLVTGV
jgi:Rrf2 family nitric oxide-sensitive transcriptional repressor